jgi:acyl carrier protein
VSDAVVAVHEALVPRLAAALGVDSGLVTDDLELATLGLSSLELMELVYDVEDDLSVTFREDELAGASTVGSLVAAMAADVVAGGGVA